MIIIRTVCPDDYSAVAELARNSLGYECTDELVKERLEGLDSSREAVFVAETDGKVTGFIHIERYVVLYYETMANILGLAVSEEYRRQGIATQLITSAEEWAREHGIRKVRLNSGGKRTGAHEFYRRTGYDNEKVQLRFLKQI